MSHHRGGPDERRPTLEIAAIPEAPHGWAVEVQDDEGSAARPAAASSGRRRQLARGATSSCATRRSARATARSACWASGVAIEDLGSKNGTFVGSARVREAWGRAGTTVTIGRSTLTCIALAQSDREDDELAGSRCPASPGRRWPCGGSPRRCGGSRATRRPCSSPGESGTGKELVARALHAEGPRREAAVRRHQRDGAAARARRERAVRPRARRVHRRSRAARGRVRGGGGRDALPRRDRRACRSTRSRSSCARSTATRCGASGARAAGARADVRVVAATHVPLEERVTAGMFRRDLFHRLEVLRRRGAAAARAARRHRGDRARAPARRSRRELGPRDARRSAAIARLVAHDWPGNVRELRNVLYRAADLTREGDTIDVHDVERAVRTRSEPKQLALTPNLARAILEHHDNNLSAAARSAGYPRTTFRKLVKG